MKTLIIYFLINASFSFAQVYENWVVRYNGPGNVRDEATAIAVDQFQNVYVTGLSVNSNNNLDYATMKYNYCNGHIYWSNLYNYGDDFAYDLGIDASGNVYVTGGANGYFLTVKYNTTGAFQWYRTLYGPVLFSGNTALKIFVDGAGNSYVTGVTSQSSGSILLDVMTAKYDSSGLLQWQKYYGGPGGDDDLPEAIYVDSQGNTYVVGASYGLGTGRDYFLLRYGPGGGWEWHVRYNGEANGTDIASDVTVDNQGNVLVTGISQEYENPGEDALDKIHLQQLNIITALNKFG